MHRKWEGLVQVLAGGLSAAVLWAVLRRRTPREERKKGEGRSGSDQPQQKKRRSSPAKDSNLNEAIAAGRALPEAAAAASEGPVAALQLARLPAEGPLYTVTQNELIVHKMLLEGDDAEVSFRQWPTTDSGLSSTEAQEEAEPGAHGSSGGGVTHQPLTGPRAGDPLAEVARQVQEAAAGAFFGLLAEGLAAPAPQLDRLAALVLDARDQLAALVPSATQEGRALSEEMREKLNTGYVTQRLSAGYDPAYLSQLFDFLLHIITRLQAPARRPGTQAKYAAVAGQFAVAAQAAAAAGGTASKSVGGEDVAAKSEPAGAEAAAAEGGAERLVPGPEAPSAPLSSPGGGSSQGGPPAEQRRGGGAPVPSGAPACKPPPPAPLVLPGEGRGTAGVDELSAAAGGVEEAEEGSAARKADVPDGDGVASGRASPTQEEREEEEDAVSVQFVVRESVQSVRLIMRVVQRHWLERHGSSASLSGAAASPAPSPAAAAGLSLSRAASAAATPVALPLAPAAAAAGGATLKGAASAVPQPGQSPQAAPASHLYRGLSGRGSPPGSAPARPAPSQVGRRAITGAVIVAGGVQRTQSAEKVLPPQGSSRSQEAPAATQRSLSEAEVAALVAAARLMWEQLNELKSDVAKARLALLKGAITSGGSGVQYERRRYERALEGRAPGEAMPKTLVWLRETLEQGRPAPGLHGAELVRACVAVGIVRLLQRPTALSPSECPETLLLDCRELVELQSELQRVCLSVAACLIAQQVLAGRRLALTREQQAELSEAIAGRVGALLGASVNLEGITVELHHQVQQAAQQAQQAQQAQHGNDAAQTQTPTPADSPQPLPSGADIDVVRRMVRRIFSTEDTVYKRVQAGVASSLSTLLGGSQAAPALERCRWLLQGIGGAAMAEDVVRLGQRVDRVASLSAAVCEPFYTSMIEGIEGERHGGAAPPAGGSGGGEGPEDQEQQGQGQGQGRQALQQLLQTGVSRV